MCLGNNQDNFQLQRFTISENIGKSFRGGYFFDSHCRSYRGRVFTGQMTCNDYRVNYMLVDYFLKMYIFLSHCQEWPVMAKSHVGIWKISTKVHCVHAYFDWTFLCENRLFWMLYCTWLISCSFAFKCPCFCLWFCFLGIVTASFCTMVQRSLTLVMRLIGLM